MACIDTGSTNLLVRQSDAPGIDLTSTLEPISVALSNGTTIRATSCGFLSFNNLPVPIPAYVFPDTVLRTSLLSVSKLCNAGCVATFTDTQFHTTYKDLPVLQGKKYSTAKLWFVELPPPHTPKFTGQEHPQCNASHLSSDAAFVSFVHASLGSPVYSTFIHAIRSGYLSSWPRITPALVLANPPHTIATAKGHLNQHRQGVDSTKQSVPTIHPLDDTDADSDDIMIPQPPLTAESANHVYVKVFPLPHTISADLTGRFPVTAHSGAQYVLISEMDGYIHAEPMISRHHTAYIASFTRTIAFFTALGCIPFFLRLDNETSNQLDAFMKRQGVRIQFCPPGMHRANRAERSIQTFKNRTISTLCTTAKDFPLTLWDKLLPQIELCLNYLHSYKPNPTISAYAGLHGGAHDFRVHPIAPAGSKVLIHDKPGIRGSWAPHGVPGFYLGPAMQHYRCYTVWATPTSSIRVTDTVAWFLEHHKFPVPSPHDLLIAAIHDVRTAISNVTNTHPTLIHTGQLTALPSLTDQLLDVADSYRPSSAPISPINVQPLPVFDPTIHPACEQRVAVPHSEQRVRLPNSEQTDPVTTAVVSRLLHDALISSPLSNTTDDFNTTTTTPQALPPDPLPNNVPIVYRPGKLPSKPAPPARITRQQTARQRALAYGALNLVADGSPLTYSRVALMLPSGFGLNLRSSIASSIRRPYLLHILSTSTNAVAGIPHTSIPKPNKRLTLWVRLHFAFGALPVVTVSTTADLHQRKQRR